MEIKNSAAIKRMAPDSLKQLQRFWQADTGNIEFRGGHGDFSGDLTNAKHQLIKDHDRLSVEVEENKGDPINPMRNAVIRDLKEYAERLGEVLKVEAISNPLPPDTREYERDDFGNPMRPKGGKNQPDNITTLRTGELMEDWCRRHAPGQDTGDLTLGQLTRAWMIGEYTEATQRAMVSNGSGGVLIPTVLSAQVIDLARNKSRVIQAGAQTLPMTSNNLTVPRQLTDPVAKWRPELGHINRTGIEFEPLVLQACSLGALVAVSNELIEDAVGLDSFMTRTLSDVMALGIDQCALTGTGALNNGKRIEPVGVMETEGVLRHTGALNSYRVFSEAVTKLEAMNLTPGALLWSPIDAGIVDALVDSNGQPLQPPPSWATYQHLTTNQLLQNCAVLGDWSYLAVAVRHNISLEISDTASVPAQEKHPAIDAFSQNARIIRVLWRGDVGVMKPDAFCRLAFTEPASEMVA